MDNENKTIFAEGFFFERPREGAPAFVKGRMSVQVEKAVTFLNSVKNEAGYVNLDLLASKDGSKLYWKLNNWKPEEKTVKDSLTYPTEEIDPKNIPFD